MYRKSRELFICILAIIVLVVLCLVTDIDSLNCKSAEDLCTIHTRRLLRQDSIKETFQISDIFSYRIRSYRHTGKHNHYTSYNPILIMNDNSEIWLDFGTRSEERAMRIIRGIRSGEDFEIKGSFFKSLDDRY